MKISFYTNEGDLHTHGGYGVAGFGVVTSLQKLGHAVPFNDGSAPVQINFCWPSWFSSEMRENQYNIGYTPWESTQLKPGWLDIFNECDEVWTTSDWVADIYKDVGVNKPIKTYLHGIDSDWTPYKRNVNSVLRFLHQGEPSPRKNGQLAYDAFKAAFGNNKDVLLTLKTSSSRISTVRKGQGISYGPPGGPQDNVKVITDILDISDLVGLYHNHHVMVYPSAGEGFGLAPLQALGTGMPVICTEEWASYKKYLGNLSLSSKYINSPWPEMHPGQVLEINFDELVDKYRWVYNNYTEESAISFKNSFKIHEDYNWENLTKTAVQELVNKFDN
jgi:glycosyltransferase involved in cell wall biosynthesis